MTNKEIVKEMFKMVSVCSSVTMKKDDKWVTIAQLKKEDVEQIEKDLEVLELLKKHLSINCWGEIVYEPKHHYQYINDEEVKLLKPNEEDIKIKEWLKLL